MASPRPSICAGSKRCMPTPAGSKLIFARKNVHTLSIPRVKSNRLYHSQDHGHTKGKDVTDAPQAPGVEPHSLQGGEENFGRSRMLGAIQTSRPPVVSTLSHVCDDSEILFMMKQIGR